MRALIERHHHAMAAQLVDSVFAATRRFWRVKVGYPQFADDPRPLAECAQQLITNDRPDPELDQTLAAVSDAMKGYL